jgi:hypothetical protein
MWMGGGSIWTPPAVTLTTYKFTFHSNLPNNHGAGYDVVDMLNDNKIPLDSSSSVYILTHSNINQ